jgi:DNA-binding response OmpR family regulator
MNEKIKRVLIVDDDIMSIKMIEDTLIDAGYKVSKTSKVRSALRYLKWCPYKFDFVLIDRRMPSNGINLLKEIKSHPSLKEVPVAMVSVSEDDAAWLLAMELGAMDWWYKPIEKNYLLYRVNNLLN